MSVEPIGFDLKQVQLEFQEWRASKTRLQQRVPSHLWQAAIKLLDRYSVSQICRALNLSAKDLYRQRAKLSTSTPTSTPHKASVNNEKFLELTAQPLFNGRQQAEHGCEVDNSANCQFVLEHKDGARLTINVPVSWSRLESLCLNLLRAQR